MNDDRETAALERVREDLLGQGFDVVIKPNRLQVPAFLGNFQPDAIAFGRDKNILVEVAQQSPATERKVRELSELVSSQANWDLYLVWISAATAPRPLRVQERETLRSSLDEVEMLLTQKQTRPALLLGWAALEGIARMLMPAEVARPQSPGRVVEQLAREGHVTPEEAANLRELIPLRNRLIHGDLSTEIRRRSVAEMVHILANLLRRSKTDTDAARLHPSDNG